MTDKPTTRFAARPGGIYRLRALLLVCLLCAASAHGVPLDTLYDAEAPVATGEEPDRNKGFRDALAEVLVRLTGKTDAARRPESQEILGRAGDFVEQFRYRDSGLEEPAYLIWVRFDGPALEEAVSQAGLPVWRSERPAVLVWLAVAGGVGDRRLLGESDAEPATRTLKDAATRRGVPVVLPLLDLEDRKHVGVADVAGGFDDNVRHASVRYGPDAVWIGHARGGRDGYWKVDWRLYLGSEVLDWRSEGTSLQGAVEQGVEGLADRLGARLAVLDRSQSPDRVILEVDGVASMRDYARLQRYLSGVGRVSVFRPWRVEPGHAAWLLQLRGNPDDLVSEISLGTTLTEVPPEEAGTGTVNVPVFARYGESPPADRAGATGPVESDAGVGEISGGTIGEAPVAQGIPDTIQALPVPGEPGAVSRIGGTADTGLVPDVAYEELRVLHYRLMR
ncbi:MAG: DUF2066 domain-containing protein [Gammaproteobacteria bacterium]|jgi:hypothetical protein|nr:DUF2066 domain-containing protein [Gammaproteobacteria bacterium]